MSNAQNKKESRDESVEVENSYLNAFSDLDEYKIQMISKQSNPVKGIQQQQEEIDQYIESKPFEVYLRYEEDVAKAYRDFYRDQVVNDKRNELGRFLFGVSFTTLGFIVSILKLSSTISVLGRIDVLLLILSGGFLLLSSIFSLRLAVPKNQDVNPTTLELVELHRTNSVELSRLSFWWFISWVVGLIIGLSVIMT